MTAEAIGIHPGITAKPRERLGTAGQAYRFTADGWRLDERR